MGELYSWMDRIYVVNKGFKIILASPSVQIMKCHQYISTRQMVSEGRFRGFDGKLFKISHEQICIGRCHTGAHRGAMGL